MKIRDLRLDDSISVNAEDIPMGTVFSGKIGRARKISSIFIRAFDVIVDLHNSRNTWTFHSFSAGVSFDRITVNDYQPLNAQLVVGSSDNG